jgi:hypothetical protein
MKGYPRFITEGAGVPLDADLFMNSISASGVRDAAQLKQQPDQCSVNNERWHCDVRLSSRELSLWLEFGLIPANLSSFQREICGDNSEFGSYIASQPVHSLGAVSGLENTCDIPESYRPSWSL